MYERIDTLSVPARAIQAPLRFPVSNVFKGQGLAVSGRIETGVVQVGEKLAVLPGDETAVVRGRSRKSSSRSFFANVGN